MYCMVYLTFLCLYVLFFLFVAVDVSKISFILQHENGQF